MKSNIEALLKEIQELKEWKQSAITQLSKSEKLMEILPARYLGWGVNEATVDYIKGLKVALQEWEDFFYPVDIGDDFPGQLTLDYTQVPGVKILLIKGRRAIR